MRGRGKKVEKERGCKIDKCRDLEEKMEIENENENENYKV